jgi:hypothetical protein
VDSRIERKAAPALQSGGARRLCALPAPLMGLAVSYLNLQEHVCVAALISKVCLLVWPLWLLILHFMRQTFLAASQQTCSWAARGHINLSRCAGLFAQVRKFAMLACHLIASLAGLGCALVV